MAIELVSRSDGNGTFSRTYSFDAITSEPGGICGPGTKCEGWSISGKSIVSTNAEGEHELQVDATLLSSRDFNKNSMFGLGWGIGFGENQMKSETYLALWSY